MPDLNPEGQRICLFGGTFDPIHCAHLAIAEEAQSRFALDRVLFIPAATPPHKANVTVTPYGERFRMVEIACAPFPRFEPSRLEEREGFSYTIDTVTRFKETMGQQDELFFLIGTDAFDEIETWRNWRRLIQLTRFIVVTRPGGNYRLPTGASVERLDGLQLEVSSSSIRARLAAGSPTPELPNQVRAYIERRGLYSFGAETTWQPVRSTDQKQP